MIVIEPPSTGSSREAFAGLRTPELTRFVKKVQRVLGLRGEVTVLLADDGRIRELNRTFRGKNKSTDVLSFPAAENGEGAVGDLAISVPIAAAQAEQHGHTAMQELQILALHGLLHLAGMDHEIDGGEMRSRESELRQAFGLPLTLIDRTLGREPAKLPQRRPKPAGPATAPGLPVKDKRPATRVTRSSRAKTKP